MRMMTVMFFGLGVIVACVECAAPYFPWINLGGVALMAAAALIANRIDWGDGHGVAMPDMRSRRAK